MAKTKLSEYDSTAGNNTDVANINIAEGCAPSNINNAIRAVMGHIKDFVGGTSGDTLSPAAGGTGIASPGTDRNVLRSDGSVWASEALGTMADQNTDDVAITGGEISGLTSLGVSGDVTVTGTISGKGALPPGAVQLFAMPTPPSGWKECNGQTLLIADYQALYDAIGTTYGSSDSTNFKLPDLRGEFVRGWDNSRGADSGRSFGSSQDYAVESHTHAIPSNRFWVTETVGQDGGIDASHIVSQYDRNLADTALANYGGAETRPRNVAMLYCIKT